MARALASVVLVLVLLATDRLKGGQAGGTGAEKLATTPLILTCLLLVVGAPVIEELFYRGLLLRSLQTRLSAWSAITVQALLFSASHVLSNVGVARVAQMIGALLFGLLAGAVVQHFRRLGAATIGHALFNAAVVIALIVVSTLRHGVSPTLEPRPAAAP